MVDMGMVITLLTKKWADAHGLTMKERWLSTSLAPMELAVKIVGTTSMTLLLVPTLELDVANITICLDNFYQGLLGYDLLCAGTMRCSAQPPSPCPGWTN